MTEYRLISEPRADLDVEAAFEWYENERSGLGLEFLDELRGAYNRIADGPLKYQRLRSGIRRVLLKRFPFAVYFAVEDDIVVMVTVLRRWGHGPRWRTGFRDPPRGSSARTSWGSPKAA